MRATTPQMSITLLLEITSDVMGTTDLDECIAVLTRYTAELCSCVSVLDDLGVPRTAPD
jgi:hypothetical protein